MYEETLRTYYVVSVMRPHTPIARLQYLLLRHYPPPPPRPRPRRFRRRSPAGPPGA